MSWVRDRRDAVQLSATARELVGNAYTLFLLESHAAAWRALERAATFATESRVLLRRSIRAQRLETNGPPTQRLRRAA